jgi:hypothetical protein
MRLVWGDALFVCCLGLGIYRLYQQDESLLKYVWLSLAGFYFFRQLFRHIEYYKETNKLY